MATKYLCDNCGKEVKETEGLYPLVFEDSITKLEDVERPRVIGEYCLECCQKIEKRIKEGVN